MTTEIGSAERRQTGMLDTILRSAWCLTRECAASGSAVAILFAVILLELGARAALPLALAASETRAGTIASEVRWIGLEALSLLALLRVARWGSSLRALSAAEKVFIAALSTIYLHLLFLCARGFLLALLGGASWGFDPDTWLASLWLAGLVGILASCRLEARSLALGFLLLSWWVPVLGMPLVAHPVGGAKGIPLQPWNADGILPMLVPQLLALGYVCLERAQR